MNKNSKNNTNSRETIFSDTLPEEKRKLITKEFLTDFVEGLKRMYGRYGLEKYVSTSGFYQVLAWCCKKHNLTESIYDYFYYDTPCEISDRYDDELLLMAIEYGLLSQEEYVNEEWRRWLFPVG